MADTKIKIKKLYCYSCGKEIGEITKGRIQKGVQFVCKECAAPKDNYKDNTASDSDVFNLMSMFGMK